MKNSLWILGSKGYASHLYGKFSSFYPIPFGVEPFGKLFKAKIGGHKPACVLFTGGGDLHPSLYQEEPEFQEFHSPSRDAWEVAWYKWAVENKVPMLGTCRGMQLFCALTGGKLIQHVGNHHFDHLVYKTELFSQKEPFEVNSIHHQQCILPKDALLLAYATGIGFGKELGKIEPEAAYFPSINALGFQWHPEAMRKESKAHEFVLQCMGTYLNV